MRKFARDSSYNLIRQGWVIAIGMVISVLLARGLGKDARGIYAIVLLLPKTLVTFLNLGVAPASVYYVGRGESELVAAARHNMALSIWMSLIGIFIGFLIAIFAGDTLFPGADLQLLLFGLLIFPISLQNSYLVSLFQGIQDFKAFNVVKMTPQLVTLILLILFVWIWPLGVLGALIAYIGSTLAGLGMSIFLLWRLVRPEPLFRFQLDWEYSRKLLSYGLKAYFSNIMAFFNYRADMFMLNILAGVGLVGVYSIAVSWAERLWLLPSAISTVLLPRIASLEGAEAKRKLLTPLVARHVFWFTLLASIFVWIIAEWGIVLLYSAEYIESALALRFLLPGIVMLSINKILSNDIAGRGRVEINSYLSAVAFITNVVANLILIPRLGIAGVALATSISYSLLTLFKLIAYCRIAQVSWTEVLLLKSTDLKRLAHISRQLTSRLLTKLS